MCEGNADNQLISSSFIVAVAPLWLLLKTNTQQHYTHMRTTDRPAAELQRPAHPHATLTDRCSAEAHYSWTELVTECTLFISG